MAKKAPGRSEREGITLIQVVSMFADNEDARLWLEAQRWPEGPHCPHCGSIRVQIDNSVTVQTSEMQREYDMPGADMEELKKPFFGPSEAERPKPDRS